MEPWDRFLKGLGKQPQVTLVGPLHNRAHIPDSPTVYVDGGANFQDKSAKTNFPTVSVGDGDSTSISLDVKLPERKDNSDLAYVLRNVPPTVNHVSLLGFMGGRSDHELINLGEVHHFLALRKRFTSANFDNVVYAFTGGALSMNVQSTFSLIVFAPTMVTVIGACEYEMPQPIRFETLTSLGLSNKGFGQITVDSLGPCFIFLS